MTEKKGVNFQPDSYYRVFLLDPEVLEGIGDSFVPRFEHNPEHASKDASHSHLKSSAGKNLLLVPKSIIEELADRTRKYSSEGAEHALEELNKRQRENRISSGSGITYYRASTALDIAVVEDRGEKPARGTVGLLERFISQRKFSPFVKHNGFAIVSDDLGVHNLLRDKGVEIEEAKTLKIDRNIVHKGLHEGNDELSARIQESEHQIVSGEIAREYLRGELYANQFIYFDNPIPGADPSKMLAKRSIARVMPDTLDVKLLTMSNGAPLEVPIYDPKLKRNIELPLTINKHRFQNGIQGLWPRYFAQYLLVQHMLLDENIRIIFVAGGAGTGKTLMPYAVGLDLTVPSVNSQARNNMLLGDTGRSSFYRDMVLIKSNWAANDIGFMPGDLQQKMAGNLQSFEDAHNVTSLGQRVPFPMMFEDPRVAIAAGGKIESSPVVKALAQAGYQHPCSHPLIHLPNLSQIRGRSLANKYVIIDEAQNFKPFELKTFLSRASEDCKYIICGDLEQFDNYPTCTPEKNGFTAAIQAYLPNKPKAIAALIYLGESQRDEIAIIATNMKTTFTNTAIRR